MKIGIIGAGNVGSALARRLRPHGHEFRISYARDPAKLAAAAEALGVTASTPAATAAWADVVALAVPWATVPDAITQAGDLSGKLLWDCTNALLPDLSGLAIGTATSGGEQVAALARGARVVKGIPPMAELMHSASPTVRGRPPGVFVAGDDAEARRLVAGLLEALPAQVTDAGDLTAARVIEPAMMLLVRLAYGLGHGPRVTLQFESDVAG